jgi:uncharacterized LabA/DUF88 family protein
MATGLDAFPFRRYLTDKYHVVQAYLFIGYVATNQKLYTFLQKAGFIVIFKPTLQLPDGSVKGNVDAELVLHAMIEYPNYDRALIVTGDGDFFCLVEYLKAQDKLLNLMVPNRMRFSSLYRKLMPNIIFMNKLQEKLEYKKERGA